MRSLPLPSLDHEELYRTCVETTTPRPDRDILLAMTERIVDAGGDYRVLAGIQLLHTLPTMTMSGRERELLRPVYDRRMARRSGAGRAAYEEIKSSSDYCPYCSYGEIYEIDHFIPQHPFPDLNVLPINLVPICHPCNHIKRQRVPQSAREHFLHPYFDELPDNVRWLFADLIIRQGGPILNYRVDLDEHEHGVLAGRLQYHFRELQLEQRFRRQAASVLNELEAEVTQRAHELDAQQIADHLRDRAQQLAKGSLNALETAAYFAAAESDEYCAGEFRN
jgi:hypothetical protein